MYVVDIQIDECMLQRWRHVGLVGDCLLSPLYIVMQTDSRRRYVVYSESVGEGMLYSDADR